MAATGGVLSVKGVSTASLYAWKVAYPYVAAGQSNVLRLLPMISLNPSYGLSDRAKCLDRLHSSPPYDWCRCGFNAWHDRDVAQRYGAIKRSRRRLIYRGVPSKSLFTSLLYVRLEGEVVEATMDAEHLDEWGYRAARQQVADIFFVSVCEHCMRAPTDGFSLSSEKRCFAEVPGVLFSHLQASCGACSPDLLSPRELMAANDVGIHIGYPSE